MKERGVLAYVMIFLITLIGMINFLAPFFTQYDTDPLITYGFMTVAATIAGFKGLGQSLLRRVGNALAKESKEEKE